MRGNARLFNSFHGTYGHDWRIFYHALPLHSDVVTRLRLSGLWKGTLHISHGWEKPATSGIEERIKYLCSFNPPSSSVVVNAGLLL